MNDVPAVHAPFPAQPRPPRRSLSTVARILVVDDDEAIGALLHRWLGEDYRIDYAADAATALDKLVGMPCDLLLCDLGLPGLSGAELLARVADVAPRMPVVVVTGLPDGGGSLDLPNVIRVLRKPLDQRMLRAVVEGILQTAARDGSGGATGPNGQEEALDAIAEAFASSLHDGLYCVYQPILDLSRGVILGHEALVRCTHRFFPSPPVLLHAAEKLGRVLDLGRRIRSLIVNDARNLPPDQLLFVNLHPEEIVDPQLTDPSLPFTALAPRVVLEITERESLHGIAGFRDRLAALRAAGYRIAIDDLGAGYAGLSALGEIEPEFVKVDMALVRDVDSTPMKQKIIRTIHTLCESLELRPIVEGVETTRERATLRGMGLDLMQGYLFSRPQRTFAQFTDPGAVQG